LRFAVHRPPDVVSLRCYRPSGGDVAGRVHVRIARPRTAGDAREDRLALAAFGRDMTAGGASLRGVRSWNALDAARGLMVQPGDEAAPSLTTDRAVKAAFLCHPNTGLIECPPRGPAHRPHVEVLDSNDVEPAGQIGRGLFHPVAAPVCFASFEFCDRQLGTLSTVRVALGSREALLQAAQPDLLTGFKARGMQKLTGRQCRRHRHTAIDTDHAAVSRPRDRVWDVREGNMPTTGPIPGDAIGLHSRRHRSAPAESDPPDFGHPHAPVPAVEHFDVARLEPDLPEPFMHKGLTPGRPAMGAAEKTTHRLGEVAQRLLLHRLRPGRQPVTFGAYLSQLRRLLVVPRRPAPGLPKLLLLDGQIPHEPCMTAMLQQHHLLSGCWQQSKPRHSRKLATATDTNRHRSPAHGESGVAPRYECRGFRPKEDFR
jgi:hypothetical protein